MSNPDVKTKERQFSLGGEELEIIKQHDTISKITNEIIETKKSTDLYLWGKNHFGQLGLPFNKDPKISEKVSKTDFLTKFDA